MYINEDIERLGVHVCFKVYESVENADVTFAKGANERNEFCKKINKQ